MGNWIAPTGYLYDADDWYNVKFHYYFLIDGDGCANWVGDFECCMIGWALNIGIGTQCGVGAGWCLMDRWGSNKITEVIGPYDSQAMCIAGNPGAGWSNIQYTQNCSYVISELYNLFPDSGGKFEIEVPEYGNAWGFFADASGNLKLHVRFDSIEVAEAAL